MNKKQLTIFVSVATVIIVMAVTLFNHHGTSFLKPSGNRTLYASQIIGRNVQFPNLIDNNTLEFFTGSSFATIDLRTSQTKTFTPEFNLPNVIDVVWSKQQVLFEVGPVSAQDDLYAQADPSAQQGANSWWLWSPGLSQPQQVTGGLDGTVNQAVWSSDGKAIIALTQLGTAAKQTIEHLNPASLAVTNKFAVSNSSLVGDTAQGVLAHQDANLVVWKDGQRTVLPITANTTRQPVVTADHNAVIYENNAAELDPKTNSTAHADLYIYDLALHKSYQLLSAAQNTNNYTTFQKGILALPAPADNLSPAQSSTATARLTTGSASKQTAYSLTVADQDLQYIGQLRSAWDISGNSATAFATTNTNNDLVLVSTNKSVQSQVSPYRVVFVENPTATVTVNGSAIYYLDYNVATNGLKIFINNPTADAQADRTALLNNLTDSLHDPNQVQKEWQTNQNTE